MTNREYMESLSNWKLAKYIWSAEPWEDYCFNKAECYETDDAFWTRACIKALSEWLNLEHKEE